MNIKFASAFTLSTLIGLFIWIALTIVFHPVETKPIPTLDPQYMPGSSYEPNCDEKYQPPNILTCETGNSVDTYVTYSLLTHQVVRVIYMPNYITIGNLVADWGAPIVYDDYGLGVTMCWKELRCATVWHQDFNPNGEVISIEYDIVNEWQNYTEWRGFKTR